MIRTVAIVLALATPAAAQSALPALKASVTVTQDVVRIGDLVENAGPVAAVPIFRAPDLGTTGAVATERVVEAIRQHELFGIDTRGLTEVVVTRASRAIASSEIAGRVARALAGQYGLGDERNLSVHFDREVRTVQVEPEASGELRPMQVSYDARTARFEATFDLSGSALLRRQPLRVAGTVVQTVEAAVLTRPVERGEVLKSSDLATERRPKSEATGSIFVALDTAVGLAARRALRPGQPLRDADLMKPEIVQRNDSVTIVYVAPGMVLSIRGKAQDTGAMGDVIGVLNVQSKRVIQGTITGPGHVMVTAATARVVENAPAATANAADTNNARAE
jgi:flagella basal body P-ring formation protein FlgA